MKALNRERQVSESETLRKYQLWALTQIKKVRSYDVVNENEISKITNWSDRKNPLSHEREMTNKRASAMISRDMLDFLAPINQGMLDEAVVQLFRKIYQSRFEKLNETDQLTVIEGFATKDKKPLE